MKKEADQALISSRKLMMGFLAAAFAVQAWFVYSDQTGRRMPPLNPEAMAGLQLWRRENCQTCHQLYGMGGHLGPDLTNIAPSLSPDALQAFVSAGVKQMPPYALTKEQAADLYAFLQAFNQTGTAQPHPLEPGKTIIFKDIPWFDYKR